VQFTIYYLIFRILLFEEKFLDHLKIFNLLYLILTLFIKYFFNKFSFKLIIYKFLDHYIFKLDFIIILLLIIY